MKTAAELKAEYLAWQAAPKFTSDDLRNYLAGAKAYSLEMMRLIEARAARVRGSDGEKLNLIGDSTVADWVAFLKTLDLASLSGAAKAHAESEMTARAAADDRAYQQRRELARARA